MKIFFAISILFSSICFAGFQYKEKTMVGATVVYSDVSYGLNRETVGILIYASNEFGDIFQINKDQNVYCLLFGHNKTIKVYEKEMLRGDKYVQFSDKGSLVDLAFARFGFYQIESLICE